MRTRKDSPRLSPGKSKRTRNTAEACDLFNYNNPSKKIRIIFQNMVQGVPEITEENLQEHPWHFSKYVPT